MIRRAGLLAASCLGLAAPVAAQTVVPNAPQLASRAAVSVLLRQAERWLAQERADLAANSVERALAAEARNPEALALAARIEAARDNRAAANAYLARLREAGGDQQARSAAEEAVRVATIDRAGLEEARRLAREGRGDAAVARYRAVFGGTAPPAAYALEYYQTLSGTAAGAEEGQRALAGLADGPNGDARARLALAQALTYRPQSRAEGVGRLADLAAEPALATEAQRAWRQALVWGLGDPALAPSLDDYLRRYPRDTELATRRASLQRAPAATDEQAATRQRGFTQLESGQLAESIRQFEAALAADPNDADALGGLGIARLRQGRPADATRLLERAIAANPAGGARWQGALDGAGYALDLAEARRQLRAGAVEAADATARRAAQRSVEDRTDAEQLLGETALRQNDAATAERRFRAVLARRPGFAPAQAGLTAALRAQGRLPPAPAPSQPPAASVAFPAAGNAREVERLRAEAARITDPGVAAGLLLAAQQQAPDDPWVRLDLARVMRRQGRGIEARRMVEEAAVRTGQADALFAAALLAEEDDRQADAEAFLTRVPASARTAEMGRLQARVRVRMEVNRAAALLGTPQGRDRLIALAARQDPSGVTGGAVVQAFARADDRFGAAEAARVAIAANRSGGAGPVLAVAGALMGAGLESEANLLAVQAEQMNLTPEQRRDLAGLRVGMAIRAADRLNENGDQGQAFERLRPVLEAEPDNVEGQLALARLHQGARQPAEALRLAERLLGREPRNLEARRTAVEAAIALGDRAKAQELADEGQRQAPRDARATFLAAQVARAFNDATRARQLYAQAQVQRQAEIGSSVAPNIALVADATPPGPLENPFARGSLAARPPGLAGSDRLSREIAEARSDLDRQDASRAGAGVALRTRSGSPGLDRLNEASVPIEARIAVPELEGHVIARATTTAIDAGSLLSGGSGLNRFGTNPLGNPVGLRRSSAVGVAPGVAYRLGDRFGFDVGTSPAGFPQIRPLGGIEAVVPLSDGLRFRVVGERRSVTDSLLSWAGATDGRTGRYWGGVTRIGGRGQFEMDVGPGYVYAGGGYFLFDGTRVQSNTRLEANAGIGLPVWKGAKSELTSGLDLVYFSYARNLRNFTYGNGGYFSPQSYAAVNLPLTYRGTWGDLRYAVGLTAGYAFWHEKDAPAFPNDPAAQAEATIVAANTPYNAVVARFPSQSRGGFVGGARIEGEYPLTPRLNLGGSLRYDKAANWDEMRVQVNLNSRF